MEIISEQITYKDKNFDIKLKPIFQTIVENQYNLEQKNANNRCKITVGLRILNREFDYYFSSSFERGLFSILNYAKIRKQGEG